MDTRGVGIEWGCEVLVVFQKVAKGAHRSRTFFSPLTAQGYPGGAVPVWGRVCTTVFFRVIRFFAKTGRYLRLGGAWSLKWPLRFPQFS